MGVMSAKVFTNENQCLVLTIDVEEGQECQQPVALSICIAVPGQISFLSGRQLVNVRHNVSMRQHHALWYASGPRRIHQKGEVLGRVDLRLEVARSARDIANRREVLIFRGRMSFVTDQDDSVVWNAHNLRSLKRSKQARHMGSQHSCLGAFELERQFIRSVCRIGRADNTTGPVYAPYQWRNIDAVRGEEG